MSRRMVDPQVIIKSQVVDDKEVVDLNEILEKYGTVFWDGDIKTVTLQIYNKVAADDGVVSVSDDNGYLGGVGINSALTVTKFDDGTVYIQGILFESYGNPLIQTFEIQSTDYENGIRLNSIYEFDLHVIHV